MGDSYLPGLHLDIAYLAECKPARAGKSQDLYLAESRELEGTFAIGSRKLFTELIRAHARGWAGR